MFPSPLRVLGRSVTAPLIALACAGCGGSRLPDPKLTAEQYSRAVARGDAAAVYELLTSQAQRDYGRAGTERLLRESRRELERSARAVSGEAARVEAAAELRFHDGESATLVLEDGGFKVDAATLLPARPRTPNDALAGLRRALSRRSYPALLALLASDTRGAMESDLGSLVEGLEHPETLDIQVTGDSAEARVPGGHVVKLRRESGVWKITDFD